MTITRIPSLGKHKVSLEVTPTDPRLRQLAITLQSETVESPFYMTRARAEKCSALYAAGFGVTPCGRRFTHPNSERAFTLSQAIAGAELLSNRP